MRILALGLCHRTTREPLAASHRVAFKSSTRQAAWSSSPNPTRTASPRWLTPECFKEEVSRLCQKVKDLFGKSPKSSATRASFIPTTSANSSPTWGFKGMLTEGARHVLGRKSPHFLYHCNRNPELKLLLRDYRLSEDISLRFNDANWSEYPLFADAYGQLDCRPSRGRTSHQHLHGALRAGHLPASVKRNFGLHESPARPSSKSAASYSPRRPRYAPR